MYSVNNFVYIRIKSKHLQSGKNTRTTTGDI